MVELHKYLKANGLQNNYALSKGLAVNYLIKLLCRFKGNSCG
jgi:hypothetical protein